MGTTIPEQELVVSRYNRLIRIPERDSDLCYLLYNARTGALVVCDEQTSHALSQGELRCIDQTTLIELEQGGFVIQRNVDELGLVREFVSTCRNRQASLIVNVTIAPTLECNLRCTYCYQRDWPRTGRMSREVMRLTTELIRDRLPVGGKIKINWFGGEPLLALDTMVE